MKKFFKILSRDKVGWWSFWVSSILFLLLFASIIVIYQDLPPLLPLYNHLPWGYERLGRTFELIIPIGIAFLFVVVNTYFAFNLREKNPLLSRFLFVANVSLAIFSLIFTLRLFQVVL